MEEYDINGPTIPHNREENFMFVDTLPSLYYDMLIVNTFVEFRDLMYSVGKIDDGIKRGKIVDIGASMREKKRIILDEHVQTMSGEEGGSKRRSHTTREEPVKNHPRSSEYAQVPLAGLHSPQRFAREYDQESNSSCPFRTMGFLSFPQSLKDLHIQKDTMSMPHVNTMKEPKGTPWRIARLSKTRFNP